MAAPKLTDESRARLLSDYAAGEMRVVDIARKYGVSPGVVSRQAHRHGFSRQVKTKRTKSRANARRKRPTKTKVRTPKTPLLPPPHPALNGHVCTDKCRERGPVEWAEQHRVISQGDHHDTVINIRRMTPYLVEILDFLGSPTHERGCVLKGARIGYTEGVLLTFLAYLAVCRPQRIAMLHPTDTEAKKFSKDNFLELVRHNPILHPIMGEPSVHEGRGRRGVIGILDKPFTDGRLTLVGSVSSANMRRFEASVLIADEVDAMRESPTEGSPIPVFFKRSANFARRVMLVGCTPTTEEASIIWEEWQASDQRKWMCPCPACREDIVMGLGEELGSGAWKRHVRWHKQMLCENCGADMGGRDERDACECGARGKAVRDEPGTAHVVCRECGYIIDLDERLAFLRSGRWVPTNPAGRYPGWHVPAYISTLTVGRWDRLVEEWIEAQRKGPGALKPFIQTVLGEPWVDQSTRPRLTKLAERAETFVDVGGNAVMVPDGVGVLTAGVDVQEDRLELLVRGWGGGDESWDILHERIWGDPRRQGVWAVLDGMLARPYRHASGQLMRIQCSFVDSGYLADVVYRFTKPREGRAIFASQGDAGRPGAAPFRQTGRALEKPHRETLAYKLKVPLYTIGTFTMKDALFDRLATPRPGPHYIHLRQADADLCNGFDAGYFLQFEAEIKTLLEGKRQPEYILLGNRRNEAIDLHVMAAAAYELLDGAVSVRENVGDLADRLSGGRVSNPSPPPRRAPQEWSEAPNPDGYV